MHSSLVRAQNVFGFFTTVAFVVAALIAASDFVSPRTPTAEVTVRDVQMCVPSLVNHEKLANKSNSVKGRPNYYSSKKVDYAHIRFSLDADLSSLFTWNTKQVFVYVSANWPNSTSTAREQSDPVGGSHGAVDLENGETEMHNEAVIWDTIITNPSADHLQNIGPVAMRKLVRSAKGKGSDPSRYECSPMCKLC